jgi:hypothetical protein
MEDSPMSMKVRVPNITNGPRAKGFAKRPGSLKGLRIGFLDGWGNATGERMYPAMAAIERRLLSEGEVASVTWLKKPSISLGVPTEMLTEFLQGVDVVVNGEGLCGSCTAASILDAIEIEGMGTPTITIIQDRFEKAALLHAKNLGLTGVRLLIEPAPIEGSLQFDVDQIVEDKWGDIIAALTVDVADSDDPLRGAVAVSARPSEIRELDYQAWEELVLARGWSDGLPTAPPVEDRVRGIIDYLGRDPEEVVGTIPPVYGIATIEQVAVQCAMAGCLPEHVPVVLAAIDAMLEPRFNLHGVQSTTWPGAPLVIVSGPIVKDLNFNVRNGAFGGGGHANAAIGRAVRLILWNLGGGKPWVNDMSPLGGPHKYAFCVADNSEQSPWGSLHTDFGFDEAENAVTVFACASPTTSLIPGSAERLLNVLCDGFASTSVQMYHGGGQALFALSIKPAATLADAGYTKEDVRSYIFEKARLSVGRVKESGALVGELSDFTQYYWGESGLAEKRIDVESASDQTILPLFESVDDIRVIVTGGDTQQWGGIMPGWGRYGGFFSSKPVQLPS